MNCRHTSFSKRAEGGERSRLGFTMISSETSLKRRFQKVSGGFKSTPGRFQRISGSLWDFS